LAQVRAAAITVLHVSTVLAHGFAATLTLLDTTARLAKGGEALVALLEVTLSLWCVPALAALRTRGRLGIFLRLCPFAEERHFRVSRLHFRDGLEHLGQHLMLLTTFC
jgi:hypothetical protein